MTKELKVFLWVLVIGFSLVVILKYLFPLVAPFFLGIIFACLIEPFVKKLGAGLKVGRKLAVVVILATLVIGAFTITGLSLLAFYQEAQRLMPQIPKLVSRFLQLTREGLGYWSKYLPFGRNFELPAESLAQVLRSIILGAIQLLPRFPQLILAIGLGGVTAYFFSRDKLLFTQLLYRILPPEWQQITIDLKTEVVDSVARFIRVECILALMTTSFTTAFFFCLGAPAAPAYGFLAGALDFLPVLGPGLVYIPLSVVHLVVKNYYQALW